LGSTLSLHNTSARLFGRIKKNEILMARKILIYGGSAGIGLALGRPLHARGYDLHLVGRSDDKLAAITAEFGANLNLETLMTAAFLFAPQKKAENH
jgi:short-subunit dehydrogenase